MNKKDNAEINEYMQDYQHCERQLNQIIQSRRIKRFSLSESDKMVISIYGKSNIPSGVVAKRFMKMYGLPKWKTLINEN